jgi:transcription termination/antitermination protein NusA
LHDLIRDGIHAALARRFGGPVEAEIEILQDGSIKIVVLKEVVEQVEDPARQISLEEARFDDPDFEPGDLLEIPVDFSEFGRNAVMAAKQRIIQRVREGERDKIREEFSGLVGDLVSGEVQQIERGKIAVMLNRARDAEAIIPWREQNPRERFRQGESIRAVLKKLEETPRGPRLILSRADPLFVKALFGLEVPEIYQGIVEIKEIVREAGGRSKIAVSSRTTRSTRWAPASG